MTVEEKFEMCVIKGKGSRVGYAMLEVAWLWGRQEWALNTALIGKRPGSLQINTHTHKIHDTLLNPVLFFALHCMAPAMAPTSLP